VSAAAGALTSQHQQKGEGEGREERTSGTQFSHPSATVDPPPMRARDEAFF